MPPYAFKSERLLPEMLEHSDLDTFVELLRRAEREVTSSPQVGPDTFLRAAVPSDDLLHRNEAVWLQRSLKMAPVAGNVPVPPTGHLGTQSRRR